MTGEVLRADRTTLPPGIDCGPMDQPTLPPASIPRALAVAMLGVAATAAAADPPPGTVVLRGHAAGVFMAAFTPDGARVVTASGDETARLWDATSGIELRRFSGHTGPVYGLAVSGDGRTFVTGGQDNAARVWALPLTAPRAAVAAHEGALAGGAFISDGRTVVTAGSGPGLRLWRLDTMGAKAAGGPEATKPVERPTDAATIQAVAAAPDAASFVTADDTGRLVLWSALVDDPLGTIGTHAGGVRGVALVPGGQRVLSAGVDGTLRTWSLPPQQPRSSAPASPIRDLATVVNQPVAVVAATDGARVINVQSLDVVRELPRPVDAVAPIEAIATAPDGSLVAIGDAAGATRFQQIGDGADRGSVGGHAGAVLDVTFLPDGKGVITSGEDGTVRRWQLPTPPAPVDGHTAAVRAIATAPSGQWFATAADDKSVRVWSPVGQPVRTIGTHTAGVQALSVTPDEKQIATGDAAGIVSLFATADGAAAGAIHAHRGAVTALAHEREGTALWSAGADGTLKRWTLPLAAPRQLTGHAQGVRAVAATSDGKLIVSGGEDQTVRLWDANTAQAVRTLVGQPAGPVAAVAIAGDGTRVAAVTAAGTLRAWNAADGQPLLERTLPGPLHDVTFVGATRIATVGGDGTVRLWNLALPAEAAVPAEPGPVQGLAAAREAARCVVAGTFGGKPAVVVRERPEGKDLATLVGPAAPIGAVAISAKGERVVAASGNTLSLWPAAGGEPVVIKDLPGAAVAVVPADDGMSVWCATGDAAVRQWSVADAKELRSLAGHTGPVRHLAIHGGMLHSAGDDGSVITWDGASGEKRATVGIGGAVKALDVAPDGRIAAASAARAVSIWNPAEAGTPPTVVSLPADVTSLRWSPDGRVLAVTCVDMVRVLGADGLLLDVAAIQGALGCLWRGEAGGFIAVRADGNRVPWAVAATEAFTAADADTRLLAAAPGGGVLVAGGAGRRVVAYRVEGGQVAAASGRLLGVPEAKTNDLVFSADGGLVAAAGADGGIVIWDAAVLDAANPAPRVQIAHGAPVRGVTVVGGGERGPRIAVVADDGFVTYDLETGREAERFLPTGSHLAVATGAGGTIFTGGQDGIVRQWTPAIDRLVPLGDTPARSLVALPGDAGIAVHVPGMKGLERRGRDGATRPPLFAGVEIAHAACSSDGQCVAAVDAEGGLRTWRPRDEAMQGPFAIGPGTQSLAIAPDGAEAIVAMATGGLRGIEIGTGAVREVCPTTVPARLVVVTGTSGRQWVSFGEEPRGEVRERRLVNLWAADTSAAHAVVCAADGSRVFAGWVSGAVRELSLAAGGQERALSAFAEPVRELALAPGGALLAAACDDGVKLLKLADASLALTLPTRGAARRVAFGAEGRRIATADVEGVVEVWDGVSGAPLEASPAHEGGAAVVRFSTDGQSLLTGGRDGSLSVWRGNAVASAQVATAPLGEPVPLAGGAQALVADGDGTVWLVDVAAGKTIRAVSEGLAGTPILALRPDGQRLAIGDGSGSVIIVTPGAWQEVQRLETGGAVTALVWRGDGQRLAASVEGATNGGAKAVVFGPPVPPAQPQPGRELVEYDALAVGADVRRLAFDRDGRDVWACHADGMLARWTAASPAPLFKLDHGGPVLAVAVSRDGETIVSGGSDLAVRVWDGRTGQQRAQMTGHTGAVHALAFTPDEAFVVSAGADRTIRLWDVGGGRQLKQVATTDATQYAVAVQPDGRRVAAGGADRVVRLFDLATGAVEKTLAGHGDFVHGVAFNPNGTSLLSYGYAGSLRIWNPADGAARFETTVGRIGNYASFSPDGDRVVVANGDATASIVGLPDGVR